MTHPPALENWPLFQGAFHVLRPEDLWRALSSIFGVRRGNWWKKLSLGISFNISLGSC